LAFATTDCAPVLSETAKRFHASNPLSKEDRVIVDGGPEHLRDEGEDGEEHDRVEERPDGPEHGADVP
jgi:hypothetical protein